MSRDASKDADMFPTRSKSDIPVEVLQFLLMGSKKQEEGGVNLSWINTSPQR
jgi:hypothetical protein